MRTKLLQTFVVSVAFGVVGCGGSDTNSTLPGSNVGGDTSANPTGGNGPTNSGGSSNVSATGSTTSAAATGGAQTGGVAAGGSPTGGRPPTGGATSVAPTGGGSPTGGRPPTGGATSVTPTGGAAPTGGTSAVVGTAGAATGGKTSAGGAATGGKTSAGGAATGGKTSNGGASSTTTTGGAAAGGGSAVNCSATMPTGGTPHCGASTQGTAGGLTWSLWSNAVNSAACITTFSTSAFSASWGNSGDFLARIGLEWGSGGKTYDQYGTISAQYAYTKTGTAGGYSYIGIYGWSNNPCVEYYIVDDSFGTFPFNAYNSTQKGTATIDGEVYKLFANSTTGSGGSRCPSGTTSWQQYWSIRQKARQCGTITISQHFDAWKAASMPLGNMLEAKILVEVGGGTGSLNFPVATVTTTK